MHKPISSFFTDNPTAFKRAVQYDCIVDDLETYIQTEDFKRLSPMAKTCMLAELHTLKSLVEVTKLGVGHE